MATFVVTRTRVVTETLQVDAGSYDEAVGLADVMADEHPERVSEQSVAQRWVAAEVTGSGHVGRR